MLLTIAQAAARIPCSERWLADKLRAGEFPAHKIGRRWMLSDENITAILQICSVTPTAVPINTGLCAKPLTSMTKTTARRLQQNATGPQLFGSRTTGTLGGEGTA
jgi:excisionase family DNA binding protein